MLEYARNIQKWQSEEDAQPMWYCGACGTGHSGNSMRQRDGHCSCPENLILVRINPGATLQEIERAITVGQRDEPWRDAMGVLLPSPEQLAAEAHQSAERLIDKHLRERCETTGKTIFKSPGAARSMCRTIRRRDDERMHHYRCDHCRLWHVGHGSKQRDR